MNINNAVSQFWSHVHFIASLERSWLVALELWNETGIEAVNSGFVFPRSCALLYVRLASLLCDTRVGPNHI